MNAVPKVYECDSCGERKDSRKEIRNHVKKCQPNWSGSNYGKGVDRPVLSTRYETIPVTEVET